MKIINLSKLNVTNMLRSVFLLCAIVFSGQLNAQSKNAQIDAELQRLVEKGALTADQASNYIINAQHTSKTSGIEHIYFNQVINGLIVNGTESSIHLFNDKKIKYNENLILGEAFNSKASCSPGINAEQAIRSISQTMGYKISNLNEIERKSGPNQETIFNSGGISKKDIQAKLVFQLDENNEIKLAWEVTIEDINSNEDWWVFAVNAANGTIITKYNLYSTCNITDEHNDHFHSGVSPEIKKITERKIDYSAILKGNDNKEASLNESNMMAGTYNVYALPDESPLHGTVGRTSVSNPEGPGSPFGWHDTNGAIGAESTLTTGNNVDSHKGTFRPNGGGGLVFNFPINLAIEAPTDYVDVAATNLFYWSNIVHDVLWEYGFDEAARNFQENNYGNGGAGSDSVNANVQASGNCNANFGTPSDGSNPTMNMFICDIANPDRDGDFDNGVVIHEYGHGISNRLTGGASVSCLQNSEQMGEGWSDFYGLVMTINVGDVGTAARGIGSYLFGQPANGGGIRVEPYSTDMGIYTQTYANVNGAVVPHGVGEIWANMLWEMTWGLIDTYGFDTDIYNFTGNVNLDKGNVMALALVTEGLKLQPCSPGFVDGRDAILAADLALYGGANACTIWEAFAKRGLGFSASQGSSGSTSDQTVAFDLPPLSASFDTPLASICETQGTQAGLGGGIPTGGTYSGDGVTDNGDNTYDFDPTVGGPGNTIVTYTVLNGCSGVVQDIDDTIVVTDGAPVLVCKDVTVVLDGGGNATITESDVIDNLTPGTGYTIDQTGTYAPVDMSSGTTSFTLGDDDNGAASLGFNFPFFGNTFTSVNVSSNGYLSFSGSSLNEFNNDVLPDVDTPQNVIAVVWDDLNPTLGGTIHYKVVGSSPNRVMVIEYLDVSHFGNASLVVNAQAHIYEGSGLIEIHTDQVDSDGVGRTQGIENEDGTVAYTPAGRNGGDWNLANGAADYVAFVPNTGGLADNCGFSVSASLSQTAFTCEDIGDVVVTVTADDGNGGVAMCTATVTVVGTTSTFAGGSWDVIPGAGAKALFQDSYNTTTDGDVTACSCEIEPGNTVIVSAGGFIDIQGNILVDGVLDVQHEGSVVQRSATATTTNGGSITVSKLTPVLGPKGFMLLGNPMTGETREGVYGGGRQVANHITGNFLPNGAVGSGLENFADDNNNNWAVHSGALTMGEGYLVKPQAPGNPPAGGAFPLDYTLGTLNSGNVGYNLLFNTERLDSPNMLGNPYASAIDVDAFLAGNPLLDAVYYWEHVTAPANDFPGFNQLNFNIGDISAYNQGSGGVMAPNGTTVPSQFMASGQGFGVKALGGGTVTFTNAMRVATPNTDYRNNTSDRQRIWLDLKNETYSLKSNMLVAFTEGATNGFEGTYDSRRFDSPISMYSVLDTDEQLCIQGRSAFNEEQEVDLGFSTMVKGVQTYSISIHQIEGVDISNATIYLEDHLLNISTNLSEGNYTFTSEEGQQLNRFKLVFQERVLSNNDVALQNISMLPNPTTGMVIVNSPNADVHQIEVIDVQGRIISLKQYNNSNQYLVDLSSLQSAMYFVRIHTSEGSLIKRVIKE
ncbi:M36 family metallopeptidase [Candidatus Marifrigoribacter sp. Uisw_064]|uniref:M36 family metallopeptidase n=1 Tax=Candidatus Marifrigoribacter sp. Uisw_064 TaxID=3230970 RepID=UPI003D4A837B